MVLLLANVNAATATPTNNAGVSELDNSDGSDRFNYLELFEEIKRRDVQLRLQTIFALDVNNSVAIK